MLLIKRGLLLFCFFFLAIEMPAQLACGYAFTYSSGIPYAALPEGAGTVMLASGADQPADINDISPTDEDIFPDQQIGFPFTFNGTVYNELGVATNGWIWFGPTAPVKAAGLVIPFTNVLASDAPISGIISALNGDLEGRWTAGLASIRVRMSGTSPNRVFTIEWNNFKALDDAEGTGYCGDNRNRFDFQIILEEDGNKISFAYNASGYCWQGYQQLFQVGLRGATKADVHSRSVPAQVNSWANSSLGFSNSTANIRSSAPITIPAQNARYTFFPSLPQALTWIGVNNNWFDPANWTGNIIPFRCNDIVIPGGKSYYPELVGNDAAECKNLRIQTGGALSLHTDYSSFFTCFGLIENNGVVTNNTSSYVTLAGGANQTIGGNGHFIGTDLFITANSEYTLEEDLVIRNLSINGGSELKIENHILDVYSIQQTGVIDQGTGILVIEGDPASVMLTDSTFRENNGTTFFGNGEIWLAPSNQVVPSLSYNNLWVRTNRNYNVQLGTDADFNCKNLLFYNPGEPGGTASTARQITVSGDFRLGIDNLPGTELTINHPINRVGGNGGFVMGKADQLNVVHSSNSQQPALTGFGAPEFSGNVVYNSNASQAVMRGTYNNLSINGYGSRLINGKVNLKGILKLNGGTLETADSLVLKSDSLATGLISGTGNGQIIGTVEAERYIYGNGSEEVFVSGAFEHMTWQEFAFAVFGAVNNAVPTGTLWDFNEGQSFPGMANGWASFGSQQQFSAGQGYRTLATGGTVLSSKGIVNTGEQKIAVSATASSGENKGWNLVGNPYPSPIDWNKVSASQSANISKSLSSAGSGDRYSGHFSTWLPIGSDGGIGINGASRYVMAQEGFFVRAFNNDTLRFSNLQRADVVNNRTVTLPAHIPFVRLSLGINGSADETVIYFSQQCSNEEAVDGKDAAKIPSSSGSAYWFTVKDSVNLAIQGREKLVAPDSIPLNMVAAAAGYHNIRLSEAIHFPATAMIFLEDRLNNTFQNLRNDPSYSVYLNAGATNGRFFLHLKPGVQVSSFNEGCSGAEGRIVLNNATTTQWDVTAYNSNDSLVGQTNAFTGTWEVSGQRAGEYRIHFALTGQSTELDEWINVDPGNLIVAHINASLTEVKEENEEVIFTSTTENADQLFWNFGDGMMASGETEVIHVFEQPGTYDVVLTANRAECSDTAMIRIFVLNATGIKETNSVDKTTFTIYPNPASTIAHLKINTDEIIKDASLFLIDISGKIVSQRSGFVISPGEIIEVPVSELIKGNYEVVITADKFRSVSRMVVAR